MQTFISSNAYPIYESRTVQVTFLPIIGFTWLGLVDAMTYAIVDPPANETADANHGDRFVQRKKIVARLSGQTHASTLVHT
jgi:hypothetical protein